MRRYVTKKKGKERERETFVEKRCFIFSPKKEASA